MRPLESGGGKEAFGRRQAMWWSHAVVRQSGQGGRIGNIFPYFILTARVKSTSAAQRRARKLDHPLWTKRRLKMNAGLSQPL
jgi:hypothetical protein